MSEDSGQILKTKEIRERLFTHEEKMQKTVYVAEGHIVINFQFEYNIPIEKCKTYEQILGWAYQLTEKTWMGLDVQRRFIEVACREGGLKLPS